MEIFRGVPIQALDVSDLKKLIVFNNLTTLCASISTVTPKNTNEAEIFCIWGSFELRRDELKCGVRNSLIDCPHAFAWTVTYDESRELIVIHCALDKAEKELDADFVESIHEFATDWEVGIKKAFG